MPSFTKGNTLYAPFGKNQWLRSTQDVKLDSYTLAAASVPTETINGVTGQKMLQPGEAIAKITSGGDSGKVGPYSNDTVGVIDGRSSLANLVGINNTWLPWQLLEHDCEIAVAYQAQGVQAWCFERNAAGARVALANATADAMRGGKKMQLNFN